MIKYFSSSLTKTQQFSALKDLLLLILIQTQIPNIPKGDLGMDYHTFIQPLSNITIRFDIFSIIIIVIIIIIIIAITNVIIIIVIFWLSSFPHF